MPDVLTSAPTSLADPSIVLDDPDEMMMVTNLGKEPLHWPYGGPISGSDTVIPPGGAKQVPVKFHVLCLYLGDPRSAAGRTVSYQPKGHQSPGVIPTREAELNRLAVLYGAYEENLLRLHTITVAQVVDAAGNPRIENRSHPKEKLVPQVKVMTLDGHELTFPVQEPAGLPYGYTPNDKGDVTDIASELARLRRENERTIARMEALEKQGDSNVGDVPEDDARRG